MTYESVDKMQNALGNEVFNYAKSKKKAAGRALGTIVEIITYYLLKAWGFNNSTSIEKKLAEYGNEEISHNVEYSLHPILNHYEVNIPIDGKSITAHKILKALKKKFEGDDKTDFSMFEKKNPLLDSHGILRNACTIGEVDSGETFLLASFQNIGNQNPDYQVLVFEQSKKPYAIFECKRVGIEEGNKKGPQTIEKAKQGAYVARTASSLQKIRSNSGEKIGIIYRSDNEPYIKPYVDLMEEVIYSEDSELLQRFVLTVGVVSNHGNWFTEKNQNKEMKVLAHSYDWLIFLTDKAIAQFIDELILNPSDEYTEVQEAFKNSYKADKERNEFTKVKMRFQADAVLRKYFTDNLNRIESWFNIIAPANKSIGELKDELVELRSKNWRDIL